MAVSKLMEKPPLPGCVETVETDMHKTRIRTRKAPADQAPFGECTLDLKRAGVS